MFGALSARLGVDNVREQMEAHSAQREAAMEQKMKLAKQVPQRHVTHGRSCSSGSTRPCVQHWTYPQACTLRFDVRCPR